MKWFPCILAWFAGLLFLTAATPAIEFTSSFESIKIDGRPGEVVNRDFQLHLVPGGKPVRFKARPEDWWASEDGSRSFYRPAGTLPHSCGPWISLNPVETTVETGGTLDIRVTAAIPREAGPGGYWCVLTVDEVPDPLDSPRGVAVRFLASVSVGIFINLAPVARVAEIREIELSQGIARLKVCNRGTTPISADGRLEFLPPGQRSGQVSPVASVVLSRITVLTDPVPCRLLTADLPDSSALPPGRYLVRVVLDIGIDHYLGVQKEMEVGGDRLAAAKSR
ncbi:MAG TPA: hypothetical protein VGS07_08955 [Thermoanaerobaculia bacterium]|jgi:hypothetical protein|nr:hypothetical protein [Thermoanaerobaculia bacterium]